MKVTYTKSEMLRLRRQHAGFEPLRTDCTVEVTDGLDADGMLLRDLRRRYLDLLDNGPAERVATENAAAGCAVSDPPELGGCAVVPPDNCRRVFDIRLSGWTRSAAPLPPSELENVMNRQLNPFTAATANQPVAVLLGPTAGYCGEIMVWPAGSSVAVLNAAVDPGEEVYIFDESALGELLGSSV